MSKKRTEKEKVREMLIFRIKGFSLSAIAKVFHFKSRERIRQLLKKYDKEPNFQILYEKIKEVQEFAKKHEN